MGGSRSRASAFCFGSINFQGRTAPEGTTRRQHVKRGTKPVQPGLNMSISMMEQAFRWIGGALELHSPSAPLISQTCKKTIVERSLANHFAYLGPHRSDPTPTSWLSRDIPNFWFPPHQKVSGPMTLSLCSFFLG